MPIWPRAPRWTSLRLAAHVIACSLAVAAFPSIAAAAPTTSDDVPATYRTAAPGVTLTATDPDGPGVGSTQYLIGSDPADPADPTNNPQTYDSTAKPVLQNGERIRYSSTDTGGGVEPSRTSSAAIVLDHASNAYPRSVAGEIGMFPFGTVIRDLDGDDRPDLAFVNYLDDTVSILTKNPGTGYTAATGGSTEGNPTGIAAGDLDGDGRADLVTSNTSNEELGHVTVLLRIAGGGYSVRNYATGVYQASAAVGDVDQDGDLDIVASNAYSVILLTNPGTGTDFIPTTIAPGLGGLVGLNISDLDADGRPEIAAAQFNGGRIVILTRDALSGTYSQTFAGPTGDNPGWLSIADVDGDGRPDLVTGTQFTKVVTVLTKDPIGSGYTAETAGLTDGWVYGIAAADLDGDGRSEPIAITSGPEELVAFTPDPGGAGYGRRLLGLPTGQPQSIAAGDVDGDGRPDIVVGASSATANVFSAIYDPVAPTTDDDVPGGFGSEPVRVTLSASDTGGAGVASTQYLVGADPADPTVTANHPQTYDPADRPTLQDGERIRYSSRDWADNVETARTSAAAQVDLGTPSTSDDVPTGYRMTAPRVTLTASDPGGSGVASTAYLIGADPADPADAANNPLSYDPADKPTLQDGERIRYSSRDNVGNAETAKRSPVARIDGLAPVTGDDVPPGSQATTPRITLTASDTGGSGVASTRYLVGADPADPAVPANDPLRYDAADKPTLHDGERIRYSTSDHAGNVETARTSAVASVKAPALTNPTPAATPAGGSAPLAPAAREPWTLRRQHRSRTRVRNGVVRVSTGYAAVCPKSGPACTGRVTLKLLLRSRTTGKLRRIFLTGRKARPRTIAAGSERALRFRMGPKGAALARSLGSFTAVLRGIVRSGGDARPIVRQARLRVTVPRRSG
jgi:hypothetical protein